MTIYFDHNATTPIDPEVLEEMGPFLEQRFGNPSSIHSFGQAAKRGLDLARDRTAALIGADPEEIVFTSGGTESDNLAIIGTVTAAGAGPRRIVTSPIEHQAVLGPAGHLESLGIEVITTAVNASGVIDVESASDAVEGGAVLITIMTANNDTGVIQPIPEIAHAVRSAGGVFHTDAVQAVGKIPMDVADLGVDLLSFSSHKIAGPKGAGALYVQRGTTLAPHLFGGHQEMRLRAGTENVPAIVGFGKACALAAARLDADASRIAALRAHLEDGIRKAVPDAVIFGADAPRLPGTLNIGFPGIEGETLMMAMDLKGVAISTGSACLSDARTPSHVLTAMGVSPELARASVRFSMGRENSVAEVDEVIEHLGALVPRLRAC